MKKKRCGKCRKMRNLDKFGWKNKSLGTLNSYCKDCNREYQKRYYKTNHASERKRLRASNKKRADKASMMILAHLRDNPCVDCGEDDPIVLDFDHVRGKKLFNVGWAPTAQKPLSAIVAEMKKCEVRCANCHRRKTAERGNFRRHRLLKTMLG